MLGHKARGNSCYCLLVFLSSFLFFWDTTATCFLQLSQSSSSIFIDGNLLGDFLILSPELTTCCALCQARKVCKQLIQTVALSLFRKASLYEELKHSVNFQNVEPMPVHTTLSASLLQVVVWRFLCLPNIRTFSNEAQNCNLSLAPLVYLVFHFILS